MSTSVRISGLNNLSVIQSADFVPVVQSGSSDALTTYRTPVSSFRDYMSVSGSCVSASFASSSISASHANNANTASFAIFSLTASAATSASYTTTASFAYSASNAVSSAFSLNSTSASHANRSDTADYLYPTILYTTTCSWAQNAITASLANTASSLTYPNNSTASYAITASIALNTSAGTFPPGVIVPYTGRNAPSGFLLCTGSVVSVSSYSDLAAALYVGDSDNGLTSTVWGYKTSDAGGTTRSTSGGYIKLPDLRGQFIRGWDPSGSIGPDISSYTGVATNASTDITGMLSTSTFHVGQSVTGYGISANTKIALILSSTSIRLNAVVSGMARSPWRIDVYVYGRNWATAQEDQIPAHKHAAPFTDVGNEPFGSTGGLTGGYRFYGHNGARDWDNPVSWTNNGSDTYIVNGDGNSIQLAPNGTAVSYIGLEGRPLNYCMMYIIKT